MPYWSIHCISCGGYIIDALLECIPPSNRSNPAFKFLFGMRPGAALACPYCGELIGFDSAGRVQVPERGWPVFRYGYKELLRKKLADGEPFETSLVEWALRHRFTEPGTHEPLIEYRYV
jgi:hypothetical protein